MIHVFCNLEEVDDGLAPMCDMTFEIVAKEYDRATASWHLSFRADAEPYGYVGFGATIPISGWREQVDGEGDDTFRSFWGSLALHSQGPESDQLLALLADYYQVPAPSAARQNLVSKIFRRKKDSQSETWKFTESIECLAVGLASDPALIADEVVRMKLFFGDEAENGPYAEVFLIVDIRDGVAALNEKDNEYREDLIYWLSLQRDAIAR